ncbi:MAG: nucleoside-diphosphate-sugar epimerase [Candidatus Latescibacterota bacterium]|jgi:nucleoside-diphosphate-sugar epimerase
MSTLLVTGASGLIGNRLIQQLSTKHTVIAMSRRKPQGDDFTYVRGDFSQSEDLVQLDAYAIDGVVHLAAVTGGCIEREGMLINVEGTRVLLQYLAARGCKKMVLASSIATVGFQHTDYVPEQLPIADEDGCQDRDGYGLSKYLMEEITRYLSRQKPELDLLNIRLSSAGVNEEVRAGLKERGPWCMGAPTYMVVDDAVDLFALAIEAPLKPGLRIVNGACKKWWSSVSTAEQLRHWYGEHIDVSFYERPENKYASAFATTRLEAELGFEATRTLDILARIQQK